MKKCEFIYYLKYKYKEGLKADRPLGPNTARSIMHRVKPVESFLGQVLDIILDRTFEKLNKIINQYQNQLQNISNHPAPYISAV